MSATSQHEMKNVCVKVDIDILWIQIFNLNYLFSLSYSETEKVLWSSKNSNFYFDESPFFFLRIIPSQKKNIFRKAKFEACV